MEKIKKIISEEIIKLKEMILDTTKQIETFRKEGDQDNVGISRQLQDQLEILQTKIEYLQKNLAIYNQSGDCTNVCIGKSVVISNGVEEKKVTIVLPENADPLSNLISQESPLGNALLDKKEGEEVVFQTPKGSQKLKIKSIK